MGGKRRASSREQSWLVTRTLESLLETKRDQEPQYRDANIRVPAMAAFIRYSGSQVAMPTLRQKPDGETLVDGGRIIAALEAARWNEPVTALLMARGDPDDESARPFNKAEAEATGTDAALVSLSALPTEEFLRSLEECGLGHPDCMGEVHLGWKSAAAKLDWLPFVRKIEALDRQFGNITALNGRRPAWQASYRLREGSSAL